jgi:gamma-glutamyltranspeptidase/glutathione hydrolase
VRIEDLADHASTWQEPIWTTYAGYRVGAFPPNSQGVALLMQMNMAEQYDLKAMGQNGERYIHTLVETKKLAFRERDRYVTDPTFSEIPLDMLTSKAYAKRLLAEFAQPSAPGKPLTRTGGGDTVFLCVVDRQGNAVAMIESLFSAFGSGRMVPGTGIILHNRGSLFSLDSADTNVIAPRKRTYHTLSPGIALRPDGSLFMVFGTPGGDGQTQTMLQLFNNIALFGMTPQQSVESPRWRSFESGRLLLEPGIPESVRAALRALGHDVRVSDGPTSEMGGAQVIMLMAGSGVRITGADARREAYGLAW